MTNRELPDRIKNIFSSIKTGTFRKEMQMRPEVVEYAKRCFPELTEKMLRDNYAEIAFAYDNNQEQYVNWQGMTGTLVTQKAVLDMDQFTGCIVAEIEGESSCLD